jgi:glycerol-3-phosphate dehydrogenase subunit B
VIYDAIVIGAGTAGLSAAVRLAEADARVLVLAKGVGSTHLAPGTLDVLGYAPQRVEEPARALPAFTSANPGHPYALLPPDELRDAVEWFRTRFDGGSLDPYGYVGDLEQNLLLPTAVGAARPSAVVPETMAGGDLRGGGRFCIVGLHALRDFYAGYLADNLGRAAPGVSARAIELDVPVEGRVEANSLGYARAFDDAAFRAAVAAELVPRLEGEERVGVPAVLGLSHPHDAWSDLEQRLGRRVFEIPTLPPSAPGMRLFQTLRDRLRRAGGRIIIGSEVGGAERTGDRVDALRARVAGRETVYTADWFVLATGGFASGGLELGSDWRAREAVLGLPVAGVPLPGEQRFAADYFDPHPMSAAGLPVDAQLRPLNDGGERVLGNVLVAGASLAGAVPWQEKSGEGISVATGYRAAGLILEEVGVTRPRDLTGAKA